MKKGKKTAIILSVVLVMALAVGGTLAYLTSTATVTNTFTVGDVELTLDETKVDENGVPVEGAERVIENTYHLIPGQEYVKDPTITVANDSEEAYVRMILTVENASAVQAIIDNPIHQLTDYKDLFKGWDDTKWIYEGFVADEEANTISFEFRYYTKVTGNAEGEEAKVLEPLFTSLVIPPFVNGDELGALMGDDTQGAVKVVVTAHAIQSAGFHNANAAWAAFDTQVDAEEAAKVNGNQ